jgi:hypothetical protein
MNNSRRINIVWALPMLKHVTQGFVQSIPSVVRTSSRRSAYPALAHTVVDIWS